MFHLSTLLRRTASIAMASMLAVSSIQAPVYAEESFFSEEEPSIDMTVDEPETSNGLDVAVDLTDEGISSGQAGTFVADRAYSGGTATFASGAKFNTTLKQLSGSIAASETMPMPDTPDNKITSIQLADTMPASIYGDGKQSTILANGAKIVSASGSTPIYAWYQDGVVNVWSEAETIKLPANANTMFLYFKAMQSLPLISSSRIDSSELNTMSEMFVGCSSLTSLDLSRINTAGVTEMMYCLNGVSSLNTLTLGNDWQFVNATSLRNDMRWARESDGSVWDTYVLETKADEPIAGTYHTTNAAATKQAAESELYYGDKLEIGNMKNLITGATFTGYCINKNGHVPYGYYDKVKATTSNLKDGNLLSSGKYYNGQGLAGVSDALGSNIVEALITLIYYGENEHIDRATLQDDIWHYTNAFEAGSSYVRDSYWSTKKFSDIPNHENYSLYIFKSRDGYQNVLSIEGVEVKAKVTISKQDENGNEIAGASLEVKKENASKPSASWVTKQSKSTVINGVPAGTYTLTETNAPAGYLKADPITFTVKSDGSVLRNSVSVDKIIMIDKEINRKVTISKQDIAGKEIPGAKLTVTDSENKLVESWTSEKDKSHTIENLKAGTYTLTEETAPAGYVKAESITFEVKIDGTVESAALKDGKIVMTDKEINRKVVISKQDIAGKEIPGAKLTVTDSENKLVESWMSEANKSHTIENLKAGIYTLTEETAPAGYVKAESITFEVKIDGTVESAALKDDKIVMTDKEISRKVVISKQDIAGKEIPGAKLTVTDSENKIVESWTSEKDKSHTIENLKAGTYTLTEETAPAGYVKAVSITFAVKFDGTVESAALKNGKIVMTDVEINRGVVISKQDIAGKEIPGAKLTVTDSDNKIVESWTSEEDKSHPIDNMKAGTYTLTEETAPAGYLKAESITFTVKQDGTVESTALKGGKIVMTDKAISFKVSKRDITGKEIGGAHLEIHNEVGDTVAFWTSVENQTYTASVIPAGKYILTETEAPEGYLKAKDIEFIVNADGSITSTALKDGKLVMVDEKGKVTISKQDIAGKEIPGASLIVTDAAGDKVDEWTSEENKSHLIENLAPGKYTLTEITAPEGYVKAESIEFTIQEDGTVSCAALKNGKVVMTDAEINRKVVISKQDIAGKEIPGATLTVTDSDNKLIDSWTSVEDQPHPIENLKAGVYTLTETIAPDGYLKAQSITFTVQKDGTVQSSALQKGKIVMTDKMTQITISKQDANGREIPGAHLSIIDKDGETVRSWVSEAGKSYIAKGLKFGTYTLKETEAPAGYTLAEDITFILREDGTVDSAAITGGKMRMMNYEIPKEVVISKQNAAGEEIPGAKLKVTDSDGQEIDSWTTEAKKSHTIKDMKSGDYTLTEVEVPVGYKQADPVIFHVNEDGTIESEALRGEKIIMKDLDAEYEVKIVKKDDKNALLEGAELSIMDADKTEILKWTTSKDETMAADGLIPGTYTLHEISAPAGYDKAADITFTIARDGKITSKGLNADGMIELIDIRSKFPVNIRKTDVAGVEIPGASLAINDESGKQIESWTSEYGKIHTVSLEAGQYVLTEITAPEGYEKAESITFTVDDAGKVTCQSIDASGNIIMKDEYSKTAVAVKKTDIAGKEIGGAKLTVSHQENGKAVIDDEWTSEEGKTHTVKDLRAGKYILTEISAPAGYKAAEAIEFELGNDGRITVAGKQAEAVVMVDEYSGHDVIVSKQSSDGKEIAGAKLSVKDSQEKLISSWVTVADQSYTVKNLVPGIYTLTEDSVPDGYTVADPIKFVVSMDGKVTVGDKEVQKLVMVDSFNKTQITFRKVSKENDKETLLAGAALKLVHIENEKEVLDAEWTTTANEKAISLVPGTYILKEASAPAGYDVAPDIKFNLSADKKLTLLKQVKDANGKTIEKSYAVSGLVITMEDTKKNDKFDVVIVKTDASGNKLGGASLEVTQTEGSTASVIESWTSSKDEEKTMRLVPGTYKLHESAAPAGYTKAADMSFTVAADGKLTVDGKAADKIAMVDKVTKVTISKVDAANNQGLAGASLQIIDKNGKIVKAFTSTTGTATLTGVLNGGETYTLHEEKAPEGYKTASDIQFTVNNDGAEVSVVMKDEKENVPVKENQTGNLRITKQVAGNGADTARKFGFIVTLQRNGQPVTGTYDMTFMGTAGKITFDANGQAGFELAHNESITIYNIPTDVVYTVKELDYSAEGYVTSVNADNAALKQGENLVAFTNTKVTKAAAAAAPTPQANTVTSTISRATGDSSRMGLWIGGIIGATAAIAAMLLLKKKNSKIEK